MNRKNFFRALILIFFIFANIFYLPWSLSLDDGNNNVEQNSVNDAETNAPVEQATEISPETDNNRNDLIPLEKVNQDSTINSNVEDNNSNQINETQTAPAEENNSLPENLTDNTPQENLTNSSNNYEENTTSNAINSPHHDYTNIDLMKKQEPVLMSNEIVTKTLQKNGKIEVKYDVEENSTIQINKEDTLINNNQLDVKVYSSEHFDSPLRVYASLPNESRKEDINIIWKNEKINLVGKYDYSVQYYDDSNNGLIDRVSWIVPHLSEQYFNIIIIPRVTNDTNSSTISLNVTSPTPNQTISVTNPISFNFNVDYYDTSKVDCFIYIDSTDTNDMDPLNISGNNSFEWNGSLANGNHTWKISCSDLGSSLAEANGTINVNGTTPTFSLNSTIYSTSEDVYLDVNNVTTNTNITLVKPNGEIYNQSANAGQNVITKNNVDTAGNYTIYVTSYNDSGRFVSDKKNFSVVQLSVSFLNSGNTTTINQNSIILLSITSPIGFTKMSTNYETENSTLKEYTTYPPLWVHVYTIPKTYSPQFIVSIGNRNFTINPGVMIVTPTQDTESPKINLIYPEEGDMITNQNNIQFRYLATDNININISNCTMRLYNASTRSNGIADLNLTFPLTTSDNSTSLKTNVSNNTEIDITLTNFDNRSYYWEIRCYDNSSNYGWDGNYFSVNNQTITAAQKNTSVNNDGASYQYQDEVKDMINKINSFMEKEKTMSSEEKDVVADMGLITELTTDKNKLTQIDQDFRFNLQYITNPTLKQNKIDELTADIRNLRGNIPYDLTVEGTKEYVKNSVDVNMKNLVLQYFNATNMKIDSKYIQNVANNNLKIQSDMTVNTLARKIKIDYSNGSREIVLFTKTLDAKNSTEKIILEIFPDSLSIKSNQYSFLTDEKNIVNDKIFEFDLTKLADKKIVYYIESGMSLDDAQKMDTVLFDDSIIASGSIFTGLAIGSIFTDGSYLTWLFLGILILLVLVLIVIVYQKMRIASWKNEPNVRRIFDLIEDSRKKILYGELESARANYEKMRQIYPVLPRNTMPYLFDQIRIIGNAIDKRDILNLLKEYQAANKEFRKEDAIEIYSKITKVYSRLPVELKKRVYKELPK